MPGSPSRFQSPLLGTWPRWYDDPTDCRGVYASASGRSRSVGVKNLR